MLRQDHPVSPPLPSRYTPDTTWAVRQLRLDNALRRAADKLHALIHAADVVALFDANIAKYFDPIDGAAEIPNPFSLAQSINEGALKEGFDVYGVVNNAVIKKNNAVISYRTGLIHNGNRVVTIGHGAGCAAAQRPCHRITVDNYMVDRLSETELEKVLLHELGHATVEDLGYQCSLDLAKSCANNRVEKFTSIRNAFHRNEELYCDGVSDFALPNVAMGAWRIEADYDDEKIKREAAKGDIAGLFYRQDSHGCESNDPTSEKYPTLIRFVESSDHMLGVLQKHNTKPGYTLAN